MFEYKMRVLCSDVDIIYSFVLTVEFNLSSNKSKKEISCLGSPNPSKSIARLVYKNLFVTVFVMEDS